MRTASYLIILVLGLALTLGPVPARAETENCIPITSVPTTLLASGIYCLKQHLDTAETAVIAIEIAANNVILDLNGWKLGGLAAGSGTFARGISASNRQNITIKNGTVRGFFHGIDLHGSASQGHVVEDIRADQNRSIGILVQGRGTLIRNNQVVATGGATLFGANADAFGIFAGGSSTVFSAGPRVLNNDVIDTKGSGMGLSRAIFFSQALGALAVNNRISNADRGIQYANESTGKFRDNLTTDIGLTPFFGGTDAGNNN